MRTATLTLIASGIMTLASLPTVQAHAAPALIASAPVPLASEPAIQPVWYDRWGRWHQPHYYGYGYGSPHPHWHWRHRRWECVRWGRC